MTQRQMRNVLCLPRAPKYSEKDKQEKPISTMQGTQAQWERQLLGTMRAFRKNMKKTSPKEMTPEPGPKGIQSYRK